MAFLVYYRTWPGTGFKGLASTRKGAQHIVALHLKHWRLAGMKSPFDPEGFEIYEMPLGKLTLGQKIWEVDKTGCPEVSDEAAPEVPEVPGPG